MEGREKPPPLQTKRLGVPEGASAEIRRFHSIGKDVRDNVRHFRAERAPAFWRGREKNGDPKIVIQLDVGYQTCCGSFEEETLEAQSEGRACRNRGIPAVLGLHFLTPFISFNSISYPHLFPIPRLPAPETTDSAGFRRSHRSPRFPSTPFIISPMFRRSDLHPGICARRRKGIPLSLSPSPLKLSESRKSPQPTALQTQKRREKAGVGERNPATLTMRSSSEDDYRSVADGGVDEDGERRRGMTRDGGQGMIET
ncbi:unnamed protein product [Bursaphelenchus xylophilus]|uniref:(pine wood nematode) hypothetical protein n=1 Tax=Bursaphelenchus xylophilus TaxID=6326 RepID=A0A1I7S8B6_BURXY|nr:unnamed protein product [Bursaphelenchus xylophilus]CAG9080306.1 unnamed protein product [Bursaphelenchus xylophilus]